MDRRKFAEGIVAVGVSIAVPGSVSAAESAESRLSRYRNSKQLTGKSFYQKDANSQRQREEANQLLDRISTLRAKFSDNVNGLENQGWNDEQIIKNAQETARLRLENIEKGYAFFASALGGDSRYETIVVESERALREGMPGSMLRSRKYQLYYRHFLRWFTDDTSWLHKNIEYIHP